MVRRSQRFPQTRRPIIRAKVKRSRCYGSGYVHEHNHGNQGAGTGCRSARNDRVSAQGNVQGRTAPDRWIAFGNTYSAAEGSSAARGTGTNGAELPHPQESSPRNPSSDEIFLGGVAHASRVLVSASRRNNLCLVREF